MPCALAGPFPMALSQSKYKSKRAFAQNRKRWLWANARFLLYEERCSLCCRKAQLFGGSSRMVSFSHMSFHELNAEQKGFPIHHRTDKEKCKNGEETYGGRTDDNGKIICKFNFRKHFGKNHYKQTIQRKIGSSLQIGSHGGAIQ